MPRHLPHIHVALQRPVPATPLGVPPPPISAAPRTPVPLQWLDHLHLHTETRWSQFSLPQRPKLIMMSASPSWIRENRRGVTLLQTWKARAKASSTVSESRSGV